MTSENFYIGNTEFFIYYSEGQFHIDEKDIDGYGYEEYKTIFEGTYSQCLEYKSEMEKQYLDSLF